MTFDGPSSSGPLLVSSFPPGLVFFALAPASPVHALVCLILAFPAPPIPAYTVLVIPAPSIPVPVSAVLDTLGPIFLNPILAAVVAPSFSQPHHSSNIISLMAWAVASQRSQICRLPDEKGRDTLFLSSEHYYESHLNVCYVSYS